MFIRYTSYGHGRIRSSFTGPLVRHDIAHLIRIESLLPPVPPRLPLPPSHIFFNSENNALAVLRGSAVPSAGGAEATSHSWSPLGLRYISTRCSRACPPHLDCWRQHSREFRRDWLSTSCRECVITVSSTMRSYCGKSVIGRRGPDDCEMMTG